MTDRLETLAVALDGGMPAPRLSYAEWLALGAIRQSRQAMSAAGRMLS
jgi:hypothetical protein